MKYSFIGYAVTLGFVTSSTVIAEFAQIVSNRYNKPFIIRYVNDSCNIFGLIVPFIWLCTTSLFVNKVNKDREKLKKRHRFKVEANNSSSPSPNVTNDSLSYIYHGSPLGMGGHPINEADVSDGNGSLFDDQTAESLLGTSLCPSVESNSSITKVKLNGEYSHEPIANKLLPYLGLKNEIILAPIDIVKLYLFHPNPAQYKRYKKQLRHINSVVHIALVKSSIYYFAPFCILLSWLYSGGGMLWFLSLTGTTVPTNACLARFRVLFVFVLSAIFFKETVNLWKIIGILFAFGSVALFAIEIESQKGCSNGGETHDTLTGALLILLAALFSGMGDVVYRIGATKTFNRDKIYGLPLISTFFFNGLYGFVIASTFWGIFYIEPFIMPDLEDIYLIFLVSLILMISNVVQFISISMTSPFFLNVCLFLKIPLSFIIDIFIHDYKLGLYSTCGGLSVIIGFLMLEVVDPPKCCGKCKNILEYPWFSKQIESVRKRTQSFNVDIVSKSNSDE